MKRERMRIDMPLLRYGTMAGTSEKRFKGERKISMILNRLN